jgi:hypothetical protein
LTRSLRLNGLEVKGKFNPDDSGSDARSSIGKHASQVLRNWPGEPQMQRVARGRWPDRGEFGFD